MSSVVVLITVTKVICIGHNSISSFVSLELNIVVKNLYHVTFTARVEKIKVLKIVDKDMNFNKIVYQYLTHFWSLSYPCLGVPYQIVCLTLLSLVSIKLSNQRQRLRQEICNWTQWTYPPKTNWDSTEPNVFLNIMKAVWYHNIYTKILSTNPCIISSSGLALWHPMMGPSRLPDGLEHRWSQ